ncbi:hypothetical protein F5B17DRAFT_416972 [Nemania serpens]|nr:hypothetical protein F5B17DRAFT_416972 [Nemania serpens]
MVFAVYRLEICLLGLMIVIYALQPGDCQPVLLPASVSANLWLLEVWYFHSCLSSLLGIISKAVSMRFYSSKPSSKIRQRSSRTWAFDDLSPRDTDNPV